MNRILLVCGVLFALSPVPLYAIEDKYSFEQALKEGSSGSAQPDPRDVFYVKDRQQHDEYSLRHVYVLSAMTVVILFGLLIIARTGASGLSGREVIRAVVLIFIIYGTVALALIVKTTETLTGVIGLLSAVAGYLFGRAQPDSRGREAAR